MQNRPGADERKEENAGCIVSEVRTDDPKAGKSYCRRQLKEKRKTPFTASIKGSGGRGFPCRSMLGYAEAIN